MCIGSKDVGIELEIGLQELDATQSTLVTAAAAGVARGECPATPSRGVGKCKQQDGIKSRSLFR